nr:MAG TPA: Protein of unknown function (DUF1642) [Caudoviricetes sp.]
MNKQELIKKYEMKGEQLKEFPIVAIGDVLKNLRELDEPEKVKIPQCVAVFITEQKKLGHTLSYSIDASMSDRVAEWYWDNSEIFARAWLDGYEVEKEKMYRISMPKARNYKNHAQILCEKDSKIFWCGEWHRFRTKFTRKQLEDAGFGWVFDCPGVEIEEVSD